MNIRNKDIVSCFPLLASVLGNKYGVTINIGGTSAYTNGKTIQIPAMPVDLDADTLQIARGYVDHEAAHIRHTDFDALEKAGLDRLESWLFNAIEDWRVENKLASLYPGCRDNFNQLLKRLFGEDDKAGHKNPALFILDYVLLTVRSWDVPELTYKTNRIGQIIQNHFPGLQSEIDVLLQKVRQNCPSTEAAIVHAQALDECIRKYLKGGNQRDGDSVDEKKGDQADSEAISEGNPSAEQEANGGGESSATYAASDGQSQQTEDGNCSDGSAVQSPEIASNVQDVAQNPSGQRMEATASYNLDERDDAKGISDLDALLSGSDEDIPQNFGDMLSGKLEEIASESDSEDFVIAEEGCKDTTVFSEEERTEALRESVAMRQRLAGLLQARTLNQGGHGRRGRLDSACLHRICVGNTQVFRRNTKKIALDVAIHILLDCSSSMSDANMSLARKACYAIVRSLANTRGVNLALTVFPAEVPINSVCPVIRHGQRTREIPAFSSVGSTPLGPALWYVMREMLFLQESRKIILILTDGVPNSVPQAQQAISQCGKLHMEVMGIGMASTAINHLLPKASRVVWTLNELAPAMFDLVKTVLLNGGAR